MFKWILYIFKKKESTIETARRLGIKYVGLILTNGEVHTKGDMIHVIEVSTDEMLWIPIEEYNRAKKSFSRDNKIYSLLN